MEQLADPVVVEGVPRASSGESHGTSSGCCFTPPAAVPTHPASVATSSSAPTHTEERPYGSAQTGGFDAVDFARRVDAVGGDVTTAVHQ
ncbi:hypothetical protein [Streptomyces sp. NPDC054962]